MSSGHGEMISERSGSDMGHFGTLVHNALVTLTMALEAVAEAASKAAALFLIDEKVEPFSFPL